MDSATVDAKKELTLQLVDLLTPHIYDGIKSVFDTCKEKDTTVLKTFQTKLCSIPIWNQDIIDKEYDRIMTKKDLEHLDRLLDMLFVSHVKVLSVLKINKDSSKDVNIEVPHPKTFVHKCYIECARAFYKDPYLIDDRDHNFDYADIQRNVKRSHIVINNCIEKTVRDLIPLKEILEAYSKTLEDDSDSEIDELEDQLEQSANAVESESGNQNKFTGGTNGGESDNDNDSNNGDENFGGDVDNEMDNALMSEPILSGNNNFSGGVPDLTVTGGADINETPPITDYNNDISRNLFQQEPQQFQQEPQQQFQTENGDYKANVRTEDDGIKNILISKSEGNTNSQQRPQQFQPQPKNDEPFFSDEEN